MEIKIKKEMDKEQDVLVYGLFADDKVTELPSDAQEAVRRKIVDPSKFGQTYATLLQGKKCIVLALGKKEDFTLNHLRRALGKAVKAVKNLKLDSFSTNVVSLLSSANKFSAQELGRCSAEGLLLANYGFTKYFSEEKRKEMKSIKEVSVVYLPDSALFQEGLRQGIVLADATNYVRDLVNEPAKVVTPEYLEHEAKKLAGKLVKVRVLNQKDMEKEGLNTLLGVASGSALPPKLVFLEYTGGKGEYTAVVGKGITFDSGGYNLKPTKYIEDMKSDMAGAAAVLATIKVAAELGIKKNILGVMPLCENMIGSRAQKPGDIVKAYNGKTIEIGNTDAEGRLVLADALAYTEKKYHPEIMVDLATLTGACVVALGYEIAGVMGKDDQLIADLEKAGKRSHDLIWKLPFLEEYQDYMDGTISDLNNISTKGKGYEAGSITGGVFLSKFVEKARWAHLDIAGRAYTPLDSDYQPKYATGAGVRLLVYYFMGW
ncbi:leucyl aminopeptidase [Candidatus Woesearchaeota archaeon]|nr:leucyl aminopeptidase [Candidatus Woesearchaeota archaeon]